MKSIINLILLASMLSACSNEPAETPKLKSDTNHKSELETKVKTDDHLLQGYQDNLQKAKDMEQEILKQAEKQKKAIEEASGN
jgi:hypothetical protein